MIAEYYLVEAKCWLLGLINCKFSCDLKIKDEGFTIYNPGPSR